MRKIFLPLFIFVFSSLWAGKSVLLINDTTEHYHFGCTGTSLGLKEGIIALGYSLDAIPRKDLHRCMAIPDDFANFDDEEQYRLFIASNIDLYERLERHDIIVINGEGTIHGNKMGPRCLLYLAYIAKHFLHKHVEILNHSCFPNDYERIEDRDVLGMYKNVYRQLDFCAVREPESLKILHSWGIKAKLTFDALPLYIKNHYKIKKERQSKTIVVGGSIAWKEEGLEILVPKLREMEEEGFKIKILIGAKANPAQDDEGFIELLEDDIDRGWEVVQAESMQQWLDTIAEARLLISGRLHYTIAALCLKTPFVAFNSNTPKIEGVLSMTSFKPEVLYYEDEDLEAKLDKRISKALWSQEKDFPSLDDLCRLANDNFLKLRILNRL